MAITADSLISKVRLILQETTPGDMRWKDPEMLGWVNDAQREVVLLKPSAGAKNTNVQLDQGTLQSIPSDGVMLLNVTRNMLSANNNGTDDPGRVIRITDREILDAENPAWHVDDANVEVLHYIFDEDDPTRYFVYPPQPSVTGYVNILYSASPTPLAALGEDIKVPDIYANQIVDYVLYRCYTKDSSYAGNAQRAMNHYQLFRESLGAKSEIDLASTPNAEQENSKRR